jgi:single-strand DNA-binding protein
MLNVAVLMGRLTKDPELRQTPNGVSVTTFTIAVDRDYTPKGQERQADFIDIVAWRNTAEFVCKYFRKGQLAAVQGSIQTRSYTDKQGNKRKAFEIVANNVHFAEPKRDSNSQQSNNNPSSDGLQDLGNEAEKAGINTSYSGGDTGDFEEIPSDDDLPF